MGLLSCDAWLDPSPHTLDEWKYFGELFQNSPENIILIYMSAEELSCGNCLSQTSLTLKTSYDLRIGSKWSSSV